MLRYEEKYSRVLLTFLHVSILCIFLSFLSVQLKESALKVELVLDTDYHDTWKGSIRGHYCDSRVIVYPVLSVLLAKLSSVTYFIIWWLITRPHNWLAETFLTCVTYFWFWKSSNGRMKLQPVTLSDEDFTKVMPTSSIWVANITRPLLDFCWAASRFFIGGTAGWNLALLIGMVT